MVVGRRHHQQLTLTSATVACRTFITGRWRWRSPGVFAVRASSARQAKPSLRARSGAAHYASRSSAYCSRAAFSRTSWGGQLCCGSRGSNFVTRVAGCGCLATRTPQLARDVLGIRRVALAGHPACSEEWQTRLEDSHTMFQDEPQYNARWAASDLLTAHVVLQTSLLLGACSDTHSGAPSLNIHSNSRPSGCGRAGVGGGSGGGSGGGIGGIDPLLVLMRLCALLWRTAPGRVFPIHVLERHPFEALEHGTRGDAQRPRLSRRRRQQRRRRRLGGDRWCSMPRLCLFGLYLFDLCLFASLIFASLPLCLFVTLPLCLFASLPLALCLVCARSGCVLQHTPGARSSRSQSNTARTGAAAAAAAPAAPAPTAPAEPAPPSSFFMLCACVCAHIVYRGVSNE